MNDVTPVRPLQTALPEPPARAPNAALLIDFDNVTMGIRSDLQSQLRKLLRSDVFRGKISVQRAYADWRRYPQYIVPLSEASIDLIFAPAFGANKKNATDIRLAIDALELVFTRPEIGTFILLSGDSDFSSLVLKLKEYGKYVVGVGIKDSSSDTLIQNCDEYYSYDELTGLTKEGADEQRTRDPWELVVEAVAQMKREGDVMRSDRLKQVMQQIDPHFDEKDVGCNRFSKFVVEAGQRGLLSISRLENGQHSVDVGPDANPLVEESRTSVGGRRIVTQTYQRAEAEEPKSRARRSVSNQKLTLAQAFDLLKKALAELSEGGGGAVPADELRERMSTLAGGETAEMVQPRRFQRLLRQAHDAEFIDVSKNEDGAYLVTLNKTALQSPGTDAEDKTPQVSRTKKAAKKTVRRTTKKKSTSAPSKPGGSEVRSRKPSRKRTAPPRARPPEGADTHDDVSVPSVVDREPPAAAEGGHSGGRNPRYRAGSRGAARRRAPEPSTGDDSTAGTQKAARGDPGEVAPTAQPADTVSGNTVAGDAPQPDGGFLSKMTAAFHKVLGETEPDSSE